MKNELITLLEDEYLAKILGFCYQKVMNREDAEDLAADITPYMPDTAKTLYPISTSLPRKAKP